TIALAWQVATLLDRAVYQPSSVLPSLQDWLQLAAILLLRALAVWGQGLLGNRASLRIRAALRQFALQRCFGLNIRLFPHFNAA
ncbi:hypothetical protein Q4595_28680, partial [Wenyingzhuangia sp. 1_MG-2023]|nr:hypothetical protein [Wenyingzhuangia sp. 1_MG-2023]